MCVADTRRRRTGRAFSVQGADGRVNDRGRWCVREKGSAGEPRHRQDVGGRGKKIV